MLNLQPTLTGAHVTLRPLAAQDFHELFAAASDALIWVQHPDPGRGTREGFPAFFDGALKSKGCLVAIDPTRRSVIGWSVSLAVMGSRLAGAAGFRRARSGLIFSHVRPRSRERTTN